MNMERLLGDKRFLNCIRYFCVAACSLTIAAVGCGGEETSENASGVEHDYCQKSDFVVFDGTKYTKKPDFSEFGIQPIDIVYASWLWDKEESRENLPSERRLRHLLHSASEEVGVVVFDIEQWQVDISLDKIDESIQKYLKVLEWAKSETPNLLVGYYGMPPIRRYRDILEGPSSQAYRQWQETNDRLGSVANKVDVLFPSLYTLWPKRSEWVKVGVAQLREARRLANGKPVYAFLWPQVHDSNKGHGLEYLPAAFWRLELETVQREADGIVIWGGWDFDNRRPLEWDESAEWWTETKDFMDRLCDS